MSTSRTAIHGLRVRTQSTRSTSPPTTSSTGSRTVRTTKSTASSTIPRAMFSARLPGGSEGGMSGATATWAGAEVGADTGRPYVAGLRPASTLTASPASSKRATSCSPAQGSAAA